MRKAALNLLFAAAALPALADFDASGWRRRRAVETPAACLAAFEIDDAIYLDAKPGLGDLRLAAGREIPYTLMRLGERRETDLESHRTEDKAARATVFTGSVAVPFDSVRIETSAPAFDRHVEISVSQHGDKWRYAGSGSVYRTPAGERLQVAFGERHARHVRIRIFNQDDRPIPITRVVLGRPAIRVLFRPGQGSHYLYYGNRHARAPEYDFARTLPTCEPARASLSPPQDNPEYRPPWTEGNKWVLYGALIAAVLALGGVIVRFWTGLRTKTLSC
ncbi:MAG TPA: DUF3999 family protein [Bryobacteraceae bacterium]|nr:DUF3999 family protein [Bryobacteraceae bacterium]